VALYLRHDPEKDVHRFPGCSTVFANDKAVTQFLERQENPTPSGLSQARLRNWGTLQSCGGGRFVGHF
jgi:hypothetical protein